MQITKSTWVGTIAGTAALTVLVAGQVEGGEPVSLAPARLEARLFVHDTEQPSLIGKDLKLGVSEGAVALWIGAGTQGHFANLRVTP